MQSLTRKSTQEASKLGQHKDPSFQDKQQGVDPNQFQYLYTIFNQNINTILKNNKICFGQMQINPRYRVGKQLQKQSQYLLPNMYVKILYKLVREALARNTFIKKTREQYSNSYYTVFDPPQQQPVKTKHYIPTISQLKKMLIKQQKAVVKRDYRSKTVSAINTQHKGISPISIFKSFQVDLSSSLLSKIVTQNDPTKVCFIRTTRSNISRTERHRVKNSFLEKRKQQMMNNLYQNSQSYINSQCIIINDGYLRDELINCKYSETNGQSSQRSSCKIQVRRLDRNQEKTINDIQSFYEKSNNTEMFWPNPKELHGYKPKSKRWIRNFN